MSFASGGYISKEDYDHAPSADGCASTAVGGYDVVSSFHENSPAKGNTQSMGEGKAPEKKLLKGDTNHDDNDDAMSISFISSTESETDDGNNDGDNVPTPEQKPEQNQHEVKQDAGNTCRTFHPLCVHTSVSHAVSSSMTTKTSSGKFSSSKADEKKIDGTIMPITNASGCFFPTSSSIARNVSQESPSSVSGSSPSVSTIPGVSSRAGNRVSTYTREINEKSYPNWSAPSSFDHKAHTPAYSFAVTPSYLSPGPTQSSTSNVSTSSSSSSYGTTNAFSLVDGIRACSSSCSSSSSTTTTISTNDAVVAEVSKAAPSSLSKPKEDIKSVESMSSMASTFERGTSCFYHRQAWGTFRTISPAPSMAKETSAKTLVQKNASSISERELSGESSPTMDSSPRNDFRLKDDRPLKQFIHEETKTPHAKTVTSTKNVSGPVTAVNSLTDTGTTSRRAVDVTSTKSQKKMTGSTPEGGSTFYPKPTNDPLIVNERNEVSKTKQSENKENDAPSESMETRHADVKDDSSIPSTQKDQNDEDIWLQFITQEGVGQQQLLQEESQKEKALKFFATEPHLCEPSVAQHLLQKYPDLKDGFSRLMRTLRRSIQKRNQEEPELRARLEKKRQRILAKGMQVLENNYPQEDKPLRCIPCKRQRSTVH
jgi:hypothetical protein